MKQQYNKLWFIKDKKINETTKQQYIWEKNSWSSHWEKLCFLRNTPKKIPGVATGDDADKDNGTCLPNDDEMST